VYNDDVAREKIRNPESGKIEASEKQAAFVIALSCRVLQTTNDIVGGADRDKCGYTTRTATGTRQLV
jgi:hypothetical protein